MQTRNILVPAIIVATLWIFLRAPTPNSDDGLFEETIHSNSPCVQAYGYCHGVRKVKGGVQINCSLNTENLFCVAKGFSGKCKNNTCHNQPVDMDDNDRNVMGFETLHQGNNRNFDNIPIGTIMESEREELEPYIRRLKYWDRPEVNKNFKEIIKDRFLSTKIHHSGFNNRRMSLECAYALAFAMNRTLILQPPHPLVPFPILGYEEKYWDLEGMKSGWPTITYDEYKALPDYENISKNVVVLNWDTVTESVFAVPSLPPKGSTDYEEYVKWRLPRSPEVPSWGTMLAEEDHHNDFHVYINKELFAQFYLFIYPTRNSGFTMEMVLRLVRDHLHFRPEIFELAARVLKALPKCFSTMHFRRGDLDYPTGKIEPTDVFKNSRRLLYENEYLYVATDDRPEEFENSFVSIFRMRYKVLSFKLYEHLVTGVDPKWIPLIELLICTQGRTFIGTHYSTMTAYIHRLRGYMPSVSNKRFYFTSKMYTNANQHQDEPYLGWDREFVRGFAPIQGDFPEVENECDDLNTIEPSTDDVPGEPVSMNDMSYLFLSDNWVNNIPRWENELNTQEIIREIETRPVRALVKFPAISKFFDYFPYATHLWDKRIETPFPDLTEFLHMLRNSGRNMFVTAVSSEGYLESTASSHSLAVRVNVIWESAGKNQENGFTGVYGALGDVGYVDFKLNIDNEIVDFKWRGLKIPPPFFSFSELLQYHPAGDFKMNELPTFYDNCYYNGAYVFLNHGYYENTWMKWWGFENGLSAADVTGCFSASIWTEDGRKHVFDNERNECFTGDIKWLNDKSHSIFIDKSENDCTKAN